MTHKPRKTSSSIVSIAASLNLLVMLFISFILYFAYAVADPASDNINLESFYGQKIRDELTIGLITLTLIIVFLTALVLWLTGKQFSDIFLLAITLLHACGVVIFKDILFSLLVFGSLMLDLIILVVILFEKRYSIVNL